jgi:hypothetical protein
MRKKNTPAYAKSEKLSHENKEELKKIGEAFSIGILEDAIRTGNIDPKNTDHVGLARYLKKAVNERFRRNVAIVTVIDHRESILREARIFSKLEKAEPAILLYATWIEHFINSLVEGAARKKGLQHDEIPDLIRDSPLKGKTSSLLHLLELPPMPLSKRQHINKVMEMRNGFVHYKWKFKNIDDNSHDEQLERLARATEGLVTYLKGYEKRNVLSFSNRKLKKLLNRGLQELT